MKKFIPLAIFLVLGVFLYISLWLNPKELPSPFINKEFPEVFGTTFNGEKFSKKQLINKVSLLNFWASWCVTCRAEHQMLINIAQEKNLQIIGINYKDTKTEAGKYLKILGNPYHFNVFDNKGRLGLELGVYATPETFIVDKKGVIRFKHTGEITTNVWLKQIKPLFLKLNKLSIDTKAF